MASSNMHEHAKTKTRLQKETQKRRAEEQLRHDEELKRQRQIFAPGKTIGPRDILVDSGHLKFKLEGVSGCMSVVKQETSTIDPTVIEPSDSFVNSDLPNIKLEVTDSLDIKVEETLELDESAFQKQFGESFEQARQNENIVNETDVEVNGILSETGHNDTTSETISETDNDEFLQNHVKLLKLLVQQKDQEITLLTELTEGLQNQLKYQINTGDISSNITDAILRPRSDIETVLKQVNLALIKNDATIREFSRKLLNLQSKIFGNQNFTRDFYTNVINCIQCGQLCKSEMALRTHTFYQHTEGTFPCPHCTRKCFSEAQLNDHAKVHLTPKEWEWQCKVCEKKFPLRKKLNKHMKTHRNRSEKSSNEGTLEISTPQDSLTQQSTTTVLIGKGCGNGNNQSPNVKCVERGKEFVSKTPSRVHEMHPYNHCIRHLSCRYCEKLFSKNDILIKHMENYHDSAILTRFDNEWESECELNEHMPTDTTEKPLSDDIIPEKK